ncbi:MAG: DNA-directed RNA polymerase subunit omega [Microthrixaceae bacterium]|nr:DNA-directed RNA polymerase subunit omega [Microthrixaceae bacterium]
MWSPTGDLHPHKPLSIAFEEIAADKIVGVGGATGRPIPDALLPPADDEVDSDPGVIDGGAPADQD